MLYQHALNKHTSVGETYLTDGFFNANTKAKILGKNSTKTYVSKSPTKKILWLLLFFFFFQFSASSDVEYPLRQLVSGRRFGSEVLPAHGALGQADHAVAADHVVATLAVVDLPFFWGGGDRQTELINTFF